MENSTMREVLDKRYGFGTTDLNSPQRKTLSSVYILKAILFGGIIVLLIGSLFIPIKSLNLELPFNKNESRWYEQLERIESKLRKDIDVIFLGSSSMYNAIDDELFERITGRQSLRLALFGNFGVYGDYQLLKQWLNRGGEAPKNVIMWHVYDVWSRPLRPREVIVVNNDPIEMLFFYWNRSTRSPFTRTTLHFPVVWGATILKALLQNNIFLLRYNETVRSKLSRYIDQYGVSKMSVDHATEGNIKLYDDYWGKVIRDLATYEFYPSYANAYWFRKLLELAEGHGIDVLVAHSPLNERLLSDKLVSESMSRAELALSKFISSFGSDSALMMNERHLVFTQEMGGDVSHVNEKGQKYVTNEIARQYLDYQNSKIQK